MLEGTSQGERVVGWSNEGRLEWHMEIHEGDGHGVNEVSFGLTKPEVQPKSGIFKPIR